MMKKLLALCLLAAMLVSMAGCGEEQPREMSLKGINLTLTVPGNLKAFTRELSEDDPVLEEFDTNKLGVEKGLRARQSYLYLFDKDRKFGLDFCCTVSRTEDYKALSHEDQNQLVWDYKANLLTGSDELYEVEIRPLGEETYVFMHYSQGGTHNWRWATNRSDRLYYATLTTDDEELGSQQLPWIETMISTMIYN